MKFPKSVNFNILLQQFIIPSSLCTMAQWWHTVCIKTCN